MRLSLLIIALCAFCGFSFAAPKVIEKIAAIVGNDIITESELAEAQKVQAKSTRDEVLSKLIDDLIIKQEISKNKISADDDELARAIKSILLQNHISLEQLKAELSAKGTTYEEYKKTLSDELKKAKFINQVISTNVKLSEEDLKDYFNAHKGSAFLSGKVHIAEIVFPLAGIKTQSEFDNLVILAKNVHKEIISGEKTFAAAAGVYSKGPKRESGGDLGFVDTSLLPAAVADKISGMKPLDVSNPIATPNAIIIIQLIETPKVSDADFEKMRDKIYDLMFEERLAEALKSHVLKVRQNTHIEIK